MILLYVGIGLILIIMIVMIVLQVRKDKIIQSTKDTIKQTLKTYGKLTQEDRHLFMRLGTVEFEILFFYVPTNAELTINSKTMWEVRDSTQSRLYNQTHFLASTKPKIVIVFPTVQKIKRYINENEMEFVSCHKMFYNMYIVKLEEVTHLLEVLKDA